jgi:endonuclease/exonuclease/phosphatase family metal-dependent hydrolase
MKTLLGDFNATVAMEDVFKQTIGNEHLHEGSNDNGVRVANLATSKNLIGRSAMFPYLITHKYIWTSPDWKAHNHIDHIFIYKEMAFKYS